MDDPNLQEQFRHFVEAASKGASGDPFLDSLAKLTGYKGYPTMLRAISKVRGPGKAPKGLVRRSID